MSVTAPLGFRAAGVAAGLKASGARDVAVVINDGPSRAAAGVFTANRVKAAPVLWTQQVLKGGRALAQRCATHFMASLAGASLASGGVSSAPGHRNGAWGALCGVRPGACGVPTPLQDTLRRVTALPPEQTGPRSPAGRA